jgi:hypothetical protein
MGSNLRLATAPDVAGEHVLRRLLLGRMSRRLLFCSDDAAIEGKSIDAQTD